VNSSVNRRLEALEAQAFAARPGPAPDRCPRCGAAGLQTPDGVQLLTVVLLDGIRSLAEDVLQRHYRLDWCPRCERLVAAGEAPTLEFFEQNRDAWCRNYADCEFLRAASSLMYYAGQRERRLREGDDK
jgi:hypothetical protein